MTRRYGARISPLGGGLTILVEQTSRLHPDRGNNPHTLDLDVKGQPIARHVRLSDDHEVARAVRYALQGQLGEAR